MRLFVAINMPPAERNRLSAELERVTGSHQLPVRWLAADTLHITLKFLGEVPEAKVPPLAGAVQKAVNGIPPFDVAVAGFGAFPSKTRPNIFWVGVEPAAALVELHRSVDVATSELGFVGEEREYRPHITVGRTQRGARIHDRQAMDRITADFEYNTTLFVRSVDLMRSHVSSRGARYEVLQEMELH